MKASDLRLDYSKQSFLFKGPFGFGKTLAALSFALEGPLYLSYWDKKSPIEMLTFFTERKFGSKAKRILDNIEFDAYSAENANEYLNKLIRMTKDCRYFAIVNDSLTFMTASAVNWSLNFGKTTREKEKVKDVLPDWDEYKVETSLVTQCIDISKKLPCHVIWTAHPLPTTKVEGGSGSSMRVTKTNSLVSYGSKVAGMAPGSFTEIYHFSQQSSWNAQAGSGSKQYICHLEAVGDEFAKSPMLGNYVKELEYTDRLFYEVWKDTIKASLGIPKIEEATETSTINPFAEPKTNSPWKV